MNPDSSPISSGPSGDASGQPRRRVVHVVESLAGGVLQSVAQICWATGERFEHHVVHGRRSELPADFRRRFPPAARFTEWNAGREVSLRTDSRAFSELWSLLGDLKPDIVHAHSSKAGAHARLVAFLRGYPSVYSPRGYAFIRRDLSNAGRAVFRTIEWLLGRLPAVTVACGSAEFDLARTVSRRAVRISNMLDRRFLPSVPPRSGERFTVVMSGRLVPQKNFGFFETVALRLADFPMAFGWVGGGEAVPEKLPGNLRVTGWTTREEALAIVGGASVYLQTALWEGLPLAVIEAMALGLPIISLASPGSAELVDEGRNGFVVADVDECVARLVQLQTDVCMQGRMGQKSKERFQTCYASDVIGARWLAFYANLLAHAAFVQQEVK